MFLSDEDNKIDIEIPKIIAMNNIDNNSPEENVLIKLSGIILYKVLLQS